MGSVFKTVAKVAIGAALAYATGGTSAALMSAGGNILSGALSPTPTKTQSNPTTGATATVAADTAPAQSQADIDAKKRLALNAGTADTATPLGVTSPATVTKRKLLGQ